VLYLRRRDAGPAAGWWADVEPHPGAALRGIVRDADQVHCDDPTGLLKLPGSQTSANHPPEPRRSLLTPVFQGPNGGGDVPGSGLFFS
jgi:hypothetical protein